MVDSCLKLGLLHEGKRKFVEEPLDAIVNCERCNYTYLSFIIRHQAERSDNGLRSARQVIKLISKFTTQYLKKSYPIAKIAV